MRRCTASVGSIWKFNLTIRLITSQAIIVSLKCLVQSRIVNSNAVTTGHKLAYLVNKDCNCLNSPLQFLPNPVAWFNKMQTKKCNQDWQYLHAGKCNKLTTVWRCANDDLVVGYPWSFQASSGFQEMKASGSCQPPSTGPLAWHIQ